MRPLDGVRIGLRSLFSNWLRSLLSVLGVVIGVGTLVVMVSIGEGTKQQIVRSVEAMGSNLIVIENRAGGSLIKRETPGLSLRDGELLKEHCHLARAIAPLKMVPVKTYYGGRTSMFIGQGTTPELLGISKLSLSGGRFISARDVDEFAKVCVLGGEVPGRLGVRENLVDKFISLKGQAFRVIGVLKEKKAPTGIINPDICIFIPITVSQELSEERASLTNILVQGVSTTLVQQTKRELARLLTFFHKGHADFNLWAQDELLERQRKVTETLQKALGAIALIALVIAGIGIMNVLLASVSERIREIGIRKAVGASPLDVLSQFVWESLLLTVTGGIIGIVVGVLMGNWICRVLTIHLPQAEHRWIAVTSPQSVLIAFAFALTTGLFFGLYPAIKAARLDPCEALAYE
jgi:putative ABC transport system permease protein